MKFPQFLIQSGGEHPAFIRRNFGRLPDTAGKHVRGSRPILPCSAGCASAAMGRPNMQDGPAPVRPSELCCQNILRDMPVETQSATAVSASGSLLGLLHLSQPTSPEPAVPLLPAEERLLGNPHRADDLGHRRAGLRPVERKSDLLFRVPRLLQVPGPWPQTSKD